MLGQFSVVCHYTQLFQETSVLSTPGVKLEESVKELKGIYQELSVTDRGKINMEILFTNIFRSLLQENLDLQQRCQMLQLQLDRIKTEMKACERHEHQSESYKGKKEEIKALREVKSFLVILCTS